MQVVFSNKKKERESLGSSPSATTASSTSHDHVTLLQSKTAPAILNMYRDPPTGEITLTEFETTAMERVQVLKLIESSLARGLNTGSNRDVFIQTINTAIHKYGLNNYRKDVISHFVLRLAYCKSNELRTWFINHETQLFRVRFASLDHHAIDAFLVDAEMDFRPLESIDPEIRRKLRQLPFADQNMSEQYYKVPFEDALDLIRRRSVYLEAGFAYVSRSDLITIAAAQYRAHISRQMTATYHYVQSQRPDQRIVPIVSSISRQHVGPTYKAGRFSGTVTKDQIPLLADRSFPLCMNNLYKGLKDDNHLKHGGRMQLGLFLKGIGLSLNDALAFWKQSFARRTPPEKFDKEYAYNIRHNYGKEGKRTQYTPYSCMKIISSQPGTGDHHGCPFKHFDAEHMRSKLAERRVPRAGQDEILELVKGHHYQVACQKYYALTHHVIKVPDSVGNHPNAYFDASIRHYKELEGTPAVKQEPGVPAITSSQPSSQISVKSDTDGDVAMNTETDSQSSAITSSPPAVVEPMQA